ncbi:MAG: cyclic nucleotide-binding domain-containing protein [Pedosphaera sp.]|nr:cyclic nucleotide-binding domain-containing protein [Pedosphaera sp.]
MSATSPATGFTIWGNDRVARGPVELPTLIAWVKDGTVVAGTWIFVSHLAIWERAADVHELQMFFQNHLRELASQTDPQPSVRGLDPRVMRRIPLLSYLTDEQLERFAQFVEATRYPQGAVIVKQGDSGNAMYVILEGQLSVRMNVAGLQSELATLGLGEFFGDFSLFDHGPRSADVVANTSCLLLKISTEAFERLSHEATDLATPFLRAIGKTLTARIRAGNKHHGESVKFAHALEESGMR